MPTKPFFTQAEIARARGIWRGPPPALIAVEESLGEYYPFEALLHEVAHAVARDEKVFNDATPERTRDFFDKINGDYHPAVGLTYEAHSLGVEIAALRLMNLHTKVKLTVVMADSYQQSHAHGRLVVSLRMFLKMVQQFSLCAATRPMAEQTVREMTKLLRKKRGESA